jgi:hypothetical protein
MLRFIYYYAECHWLNVVMLGVVMLNVVGVPLNILGGSNHKITYENRKIILYYGALVP